MYNVNQVILLKHALVVSNLVKQEGPEGKSSDFASPIGTGSVVTLE